MNPFWTRNDVMRTLVCRIRYSVVGALVVLVTAWPNSSWSAPPPPQGGHLPLHQGGNNRAGFPPLNQTVSVAAPSPRSAGSLIVSCSPNPFRARTELRFAVRPNERGRLRVFTIDGRLVRMFAIEPRAEAGAVGVVWDGRDQRGRRLGSAAFVYRLELGSRSAEGKILLLR